MPYFAIETKYRITRDKLSTTFCPYFPWGGCGLSTDHGKVIAIDEAGAIKAVAAPAPTISAVRSG
jgi:hypothetical protein